MDSKQNQTATDLDSQLKGDAPPILTRAIEYLLVNNPKHPVAEKYKELLIKYENDFDKMIDAVPKEKVIILPELKPIRAKSLYEIFKVNFPLVNGKEFNETANNGEAKELVYTLIAYFLQRKSFFNSPLLNEQSVPSLKKGWAIIGEPGIGKTAIVKTFYEIFRYASVNPLLVKDIEGTDQLLRRYNLQFKYNSVDEVVKQYEAANRHDKEVDRDYHLSLFHKRYELGENLFDDLLSEDLAKNYGSVDLMKKILSERYVNKSNTFLTLNYYGKDVRETLKEYKSRYGDRLYDRFYESFNIIELQGVTLRK
ncbi:hypothetical protein [Chryseobacterium vrystaatense]|uniref:DNA replication protein DnaC n=1 Tax=Chryseobacterium vrystaatense TaxID=307480 RepID=A0A1M4ZGP7_9FLAO|nr:hypothetical protein [Chryseobacterium vrystaatense]SHF17181.1 DNA replication protein DnaC [Chryseobacterium vrystaatense]